MKYRRVWYGRIVILIQIRFKMRVTNNLSIYLCLCSIFTRGKVVKIDRVYEKALSQLVRSPLMSLLA